MSEKCEKHGWTSPPERPHCVADERDELRAKLDECEAECAEMREAWTIGRGRVMANFAHVPEVVRVVDWLDAAPHKAIYDTSCGKGWVRVGELEQTIQGLRFSLEDWKSVNAVLERGLGVMPGTNIPARLHPYTGEVEWIEREIARLEALKESK